MPWHLALGIHGHDYFGAISSGQERGIYKKYRHDFKTAPKVQGSSPLMMYNPQAQMAETCQLWASVFYIKYLKSGQEHVAAPCPVEEGVEQVPLGNLLEWLHGYLCLPGCCESLLPKHKETDLAECKIHPGVGHPLGLASHSGIVRRSTRWA